MQGRYVRYLRCPPDGILPGRGSRRKKNGVRPFEVLKKNNALKGPLKPGEGSSIVNVLLPTLLACGLALRGGTDNHCANGYLCQPAYCLDDALRGPAEPYVPQSGDIYLATDRSRIIQAGHRLALSGAPHHSGIVIVLPDGRPAILESGPFNTLHVEIVDLRHDLHKHDDRGEKVWIRKRRTPLSADQCVAINCWAREQEHKRFAAGRMLRQMTPFRARGPLLFHGFGAPHGARDRYFCSELVLETCVAIGLLPAETTRPSATYPRDLFFEHSDNAFLNQHFTLADGWHPPARWMSQAN
jgi:hypothetical protein